MSDAPGQCQQEMENTLQKHSAFEKNNISAIKKLKKRLKKILFKRGKNGASTVFFGGSPGVGKKIEIEILVEDLDTI